MFSIAAINDTDSKGQWEPLAPTKEAQEFHLSQTYHEGLLKLQAKDYEKACELLEAVLKDPLISNPQVNGSSTDSHLLQLRFLTLKNLAGAFLQRGCTHYDSALQCYLQAVEIDSNDSVVWNQLGTLSCSIDLLSISRWAFEQGLLCSPNNWNCMEKLLEVLIAIGDEVSCLSVAELILKHWPSHSRALHVKSTIEEPEPSPFAPRGIDKLEPKHVRLKFTDKKRKVIDENLHDKIATPSKRLNQNIDLHLTEVTWPALADELLKILLPLSRRDSELENEYKSGDIRLSIHLPSSSQDDRFNPVKEDISVVDSEKDTIGNQKEANNSEEQPQERRSTRLERLRSRKPGKEELDFSVNKDLGKVVLQYLQPFIAEDSDNAFRCSVDVQPHSLGNESDDIKKFVMDNSKNYGAFHISHLLLEDIASKYVLFQDNFVNFLELEKLTRQWGQNRTPECSLFLAELYYDFGVPCSDSVKLSEFMSEASYHLCKIIESVVSDYPFDLKTTLESSIITEKGSFWVRFFWLSGRLSILEGNKAKAQQEFSTALSILRNNKNPDSSLVSVLVPHCRVIKKLSFDRIYSEINILEIDLLMKKTVGELLGKEMYSECIDLLSPLIFSLKNELPSWDKGDEGFATSIEISAIDALIEACEKVKLLNIEVYMNCHRRKLQLLALSAGMEECIDSQQEFHKKLVSKALSVSEIDLKEKQSSHWTDLVAEEVKGISRCASKVRNMIDQSLNSSGLTVPLSTIGEIQYLLMAIMCNIATILACNKYSVLSITDEIEEKQKCCFVDAAVAFCKFQHLNQTIPIKSQVELIVAVHDLLAEYGLCCMGEDGEGVEGTFLRLAIKHLLALDMNLKSNFHFINYSNLNTEMSQNSICETITEKDARKGINSESNDNGDEITDGKFINGENGSSICVESVNKLTEEEREELELGLDNALNQCFFCLYGLNLRSDTSFEDDLAMHKNTSRGDYQTREQCADVFQYILPYAKASSKTGLIKLRRVLRAIRKHFPQPPEDVLSGNPVDKFLDDLSLCENKLSEEVESDGFLESIMKTYFPSSGRLKQNKTSSIGSSEPFLEVYSNLYYLLAQSEEISATDKWPGFVLTKEGEEFVEQNARLFKYDLLYNPLRFESWQRLANLYDEEVDLLLNDGSKHINVAGWRKNPTLPQRVETSRRRSRRCLLMSLALAKTPAQQSEIHELLALVYYDSLQNVVPFYDQRSVLPLKDETWKMFCQNSLRHFEKAFANRQDWSHAFYLGKLCEKLGYTHEISLSYYEKAIALNSSAVDPFYRMHASRLKLLYTFGKQNVEALKNIAAYSFSLSTKETVTNILGKLSSGEEKQSLESHQLVEVSQMLYNDCISALAMCLEGELKHFHRARYRLAQGLYRRGESGDLERAKEELSFCFKSSRSSFTINMWEIDSMVKKGRRKTPGLGSNKKSFEVNLPESSRKFITCIRKYILFYLKLLEETGDICTLDRAYISLRTDKRFSLCLEDLLPIALGMYVKALISCIHQSETTCSDPSSSSVVHLLEKMFTLFMEQVYIWPDISSLSEVKSPDLLESNLYGYLFQYIRSLEKELKLETLETINEKIRKRYKNPKLSNSNCAKVCRHASTAWCRSLIISLALITPLTSKSSTEAQVVHNPSDIVSGNAQNTPSLCIDLQTKELWNSSFEDPIDLKNHETKWGPLVSKIKNVVIKKASGENLEKANTLLRCSYNFYKESSWVMLPSVLNLYLVPPHLGNDSELNPSVDGAEILDLSIQRKLLLWAYMLLYGRYANISVVIKHCEENAKSRIKKVTASSSTPSSTSAAPATTSHIVVGSGKDESGPRECSEAVGSGEDETGPRGCSEVEGALSAAMKSSSLVPEGEVACAPNSISSNDSQKGAFDSSQLQHCSSIASKQSNMDLNNGENPSKD